ncbi:hypothetical protein AB3R30_18545 [Leptolyngbyaceae cyanobacterium UHCC 1019]
MVETRGAIAFGSLEGGRSRVVLGEGAIVLSLLNAIACCVEKARSPVKLSNFK